MVTRAKPKAVYGHTTESFGADPSDLDKSYDFRYKVLSLDDVITSHTENMAANPEYPQELQPRIRDRAASRIQVDRMAANLNPRALLHDTGFLDTGPMIVGSDNVVESGNGRTIALRKAADDHPDKYELYQGMLAKMADRYGISQSELAGIKNPVLVRERVTPVDRVAFAAEANIGAVMSMSPHEQALQDSGRLSPNVINTLEVGEDQSIDEALRAKSNSHIISHFMKNIPANERATVSDAKGNVNQAGILRLKLAIFARTYSGDAGQRLTRTFSESLDPVVKSIENAMFQSLPDMAKAESLIDSKQRDRDLSIAPDLAEVVETYAGLKQSGITVADYLKQSALFEDRLTPLQKQIIAHFSDIARSPKKLRTFLRETAQRIVDAPAEGQSSLMGMDMPTKEEIVNAIIKQQREEYGLPALPSTTAPTPSAPMAKPDTRRVEEAVRLGEGVGRGRPETGITLAPGTSAQVGLAGIGPEAVQVKAFEEFGGAPGAGGQRMTFVDVEAIKAAEKAKPLPGQITLKEKQPWQMTRGEFRFWEDKPKLDAIQSAIQRGDNIVLATQYKATRLARPEQIRITDSGSVQIPEGKKWVTLTDSQVVALASQAGVAPTPMDQRVYHHVIVRDAISKGKSVPVEVLKDYPELKTKPRKPRKPTREKAKRLLKSELQEIQANRSTQSQAMDNAQLHSKVVPVTSPKTSQWARNQGTMDVKGIDTPSGRPPSITKKGTPRITGRSVRITKRMPRLK